MSGIEEKLVSFKEGDGKEIHSQLMADTFSEQMLDVSIKHGLEFVVQYMIDIGIEKQRQKEIIKFIKKNTKMEKIKRKINIVNLTPASAGKTRIPVKKLPERTAKRIRKQAKKEKQMVQLKTFLAIAIGLIILLLILLFTATKMYADDSLLTTPKYSDDRCNSDKCRARVERLNVCDSVGHNNVVECATNKTLEAMKPMLYKNIEQLTEPTASVSVSWKQKAINLAAEHEKFSPTPYCDHLKPYTKPNGKRGLKKACYTGKERHSSGYGTISYKGAPPITESEARQRMYDVFENSFFPLVENLSCWNDNQKAAIADFAYNSGAARKHAKTGKPFSHYVKTCNYDEVLGFMDYWLYSGGVVARKKAERELFLSNN